MYIDRILFPIQALGPGDRLVIWTAGCSKHCDGCANPELWSTEGRRSRGPLEIARIINNIAAENSIGGITVTGGDPLEQPEELLELLRLVSCVTDDILVYTGYTLVQLCCTLTQEQYEELRSLVSVLAEGPYIRELNTPDTVLLGSSNQSLVYFREELRERYREYLSEGRKIQNVFMGKRMISVGIHNRQKNND